MGRIRAATFVRPLLELPVSRPVRSRIMATEAQRELAFVKRQAAIASLPLLSTERLSRKLESKSEAETFYVLGSGSSIEDLTEAHFDQIAGQASVGINNWGVHPFIPDIYSLESVPWVGDGEDFVRAMRLLDRSDIVSRRPEILILRPKTASEIDQIIQLPSSLRNSVSFYGRITPATRHSGNLGGDMSEFFANIAPRCPSLVLDSGASVVRMVVLGILLGFRRIVLAGVDLNGSPYFWESNPTYLQGLTSSPPVNNQVLARHETASTSNRPFDVITMLSALGRYFHTQRGGQLLVTSPHSALAQFLPLETWEEH
jgi:hypothetical protein